MSNQIPENLKYAQCGACQHYNGYQAKCIKYNITKHRTDSRCNNIKGW